MGLGNDAGSGLGSGVISLNQDAVAQAKPNRPPVGHAFGWSGRQSREALFLGTPASKFAG